MDSPWINSYDQHCAVHGLTPLSFKQLLVAYLWLCSWPLVQLFWLKYLHHQWALKGPRVGVLVSKFLSCVLLIANILLHLFYAECLLSHICCQVFLWSCIFVDLPLNSFNTRWLVQTAGYWTGSTDVLVKPKEEISFHVKCFHFLFCFPRQISPFGQ